MTPKGSNVLEFSDEPLEEKEFPDEADVSDDEASETFPCPRCGLAVFDDADWCPHCKEWITLSGASWGRTDKWYVRTGRWAVRTILMNWLVWLGLGLLAAVLWIARLASR